MLRLFQFDIIIMQFLFLGRNYTYFNIQITI